MADFIDNTLTVSQLIEELQNYPSDMPVVLQHNYGDRIETQEALFITEPSTAYLAETGYSDSGWKVVDDSNDDSEEESIKVVVLSYQSTY